MNAACSCISAVKTAEYGISKQDRRAHVFARLGIRRNAYRVEPGLYAIGAPGDEAPVFISANYKLSFDSLRSALHTISAWIIVLDTKGINVWCAAGKGTFGTEELINRIRAADLENCVKHRNLIVPQLGAPGIAAHTVKRETGFTAIYGPVRAEDIKEFLKSGLKADKKMRTVTFTLRERAVLVPVEIKQWSMLLAGILPYLLLFNILETHGIHIGLLRESLKYWGAVAVGAAAGPVLLPFIPGKPLSWKGWLIGLLYTAAVFLPRHPAPMILASHFLLLPAVSAFVHLNFTGCTPYTSLSGVKLEMKIAVPLILVSAAAGIILRILNLILR